MKNLGVVITDGVGFRNFILSDFIQEAKTNFEEVIIFSCLPKTVYKDLDLNCRIIELEVLKNHFTPGFLEKPKKLHICNYMQKVILALLII